MPLPAFEDFLYGAVLIDWEELRREDGADRRALRRAPRRCGSSAPETDLTFSLAGREGKVDALGANMPGGEIFYSPVEDSAEGVISYSEYPACYLGHEVGGVRLPLRGRARSSRHPRPATRSSCSARSTPTRARGGSASSGSAATRASSGT